MGIFLPLTGMIVLLALAVALSTNRKAINKRTVASAFALLAAVAGFILFFPIGKAFLASVGAAVQYVINYSNQGISFLFGELVTDKVGFVFALRILPVIIFFSSLMAVLYYLGIMQWVVRIIGGTFQKIIGTRRVESIYLSARRKRRWSCDPISSQSASPSCLQSW
jgi:CNT family concentrative nucleoside transporter